MPELCTTIGDFAVSFTATAGVTPARGARLLIASDGTYGLAPIGDAGCGFNQYTVSAAGGSGTYKPNNANGTQVGIASEAIAVGDDVFSAANGKCSTTAAGAVFLGRAKQAATGDGVLFELIIGGTVPV
jgi:hypothetical protein